MKTVIVGFIKLIHIFGKFLIGGFQDVKFLRSYISMEILER